jgi:hypothetical protein
MSFSDNFNANDNWSKAPAANPDNGDHLAHIRNEVTHTPYDQPNFYGVNLGIIKLGFTSDGAFNPGVDLGIVHAQAKVGLVNGADAGVRLGPIADAKAGGYVGVDQNGIHGDVGARGQALTLAGAGGEVHTRLGNATGVEANAGAHVGPLGTRGGAGAAIGDDGFDAAAGGGARVGRALSAHSGADVALGYDSQAAVAAGGNIGNMRGRAGAGVWTDGDTTVRPDAYVAGAAGRNDGVLDINPPDYGRPAYPGARSAEVYPAVPASAPIEIKQLPPVYEAATPENLARVETQIRTQLCNQDKVTVQKGDTYEKIAERLMPGASSDQLAAEAKKLQGLHESNGYHSLKAGQKLATEDPYTIDRQVRQQVAAHFGWAPPQA